MSFLRRLAGREDAEEAIETTTTYSPYSGLKVGEFRLIQFDGLDRIPRDQPLDRATPIVLNMRKFTIDDPSNPRYFALSYRWGETQRSVAVTVGHKKVAITPTLHQALVELRELQHQRALTDSDDDIDRWWWIDMICINQGPVEEMMPDIGLYHGVKDAFWKFCLDDKALQIPRMRHIYDGLEDETRAGGPRNAVTIVWLGSADRAVNTDYRAAMQMIRQNVLPANDAQWGELTRLLNDKYWGRVWIIQEVCVSVNLYVVNNAQRVTWGQLEAFMGRLQPRGSSHFLNTLIRMRNTFQGRGTHAGEPCTLAYFVNQAYISFATNCSYSHDRVYALLGVAKDSDQQMKKDLFAAPRYDISPCSVYSQGIRLMWQDLENEVAQRRKSGAGMDEFQQRVQQRAVRDNAWHDPFTKGSVQDGCRGMGSCQTYEIFLWLSRGVEVASQLQLG